MKVALHALLWSTKVRRMCHHATTTAFSGLVQGYGGRGSGRHDGKRVNTRPPVCFVAQAQMKSFFEPASPSSPPLPRRQQQRHLRHPGVFYSPTYAESHCNSRCRNMPRSRLMRMAQMQAPTVSDVAQRIHARLCFFPSGPCGHVSPSCRERRHEEVPSALGLAFHQVTEQPPEAQVYRTSLRGNLAPVSHCAFADLDAASLSLFLISHLIHTHPSDIAGCAAVSLSSLPFAGEYLIR